MHCGFCKFKRLNIFNQLLLIVLVSFLLGELLQFFLERFYGKGIFNIDFSNYSSFSEVVVEVILLAPLIETFLVQFIIIEISLQLLSRKKYKYIYSILFSASVFGILHQYNVAYVIATFVLGLWFGSLYIFYKKNKKIKPFLAVLLVHLVYNSINLIKEYYL